MSQPAIASLKNFKLVDCKVSQYKKYALKTKYMYNVGYKVQAVTCILMYGEDKDNKREDR